ncbi:MAG: 5'-nucleotidase C-terminal domain-containing protein [Ichthyobacteriaceae bacterium]|nr:5'-nucleotidase C-terminal domain-containing protein [Ichthyobacteriaceae bacterium]
MKKLAILLFAIMVASTYSCFTAQKITSTGYSYNEVGNDIEGDKNIEEFIKPYHDSVIVKLNHVISYTKSDLWRSHDSLETPMGNLLADLLLEQGNIRSNKYYNSKADIALFNKGGIRTSIKKGDILLRHMFEIMPFENTLVVVTLSAEKFKEMIDYIVKTNGQPMSNISIKVKENKADEVFINNEPFNENKQYKVITTDYLQHGGDHMKFFVDPVKLDTLEYKMREAMIDYFEKTDTVEVKLDGRFSYAN